MQISLKRSQGQKYAKITQYTKFQPLMISNSLCIGASVLPAFAQPVLYNVQFSGTISATAIQLPLQVGQLAKLVDRSPYKNLTHFWAVYAVYAVYDY